MFRQMLRAKIHRATVTEACLEYEGSLTVDEDLLDAAGDSAVRSDRAPTSTTASGFVTLRHEGEAGKGEIVLNGPTARKAAVGDQIIIFCYSITATREIKRHKPRIIQVDGKNRITRKGCQTLMSLMSIHKLTLAELQRRFTAGDVSATEIVRAYFCG